MNILKLKNNVTNIDNINIFINLRTPINLNNGLKLTCITQMIFNIPFNKDEELDVSTEFIDYEDMNYMGKDISKYDIWKSFLDNNRSIGIDFRELIQEEYNKVFDEKTKDKIITYYKNIING